MNAMSAKTRHHSLLILMGSSRGRSLSLNALDVINLQPSLGGISSLSTKRKDNFRVTSSSENGVLNKDDFDVVRNAASSTRSMEYSWIAPFVLDPSHGISSVLGRGDEGIGIAEGMKRDFGGSFEELRSPSKLRSSQSAVDPSMNAMATWGLSISSSVAASLKTHGSVGSGLGKLQKSGRSLSEAASLGVLFRAGGAFATDPENSVKSEPEALGRVDGIVYDRNNHAKSEYFQLPSLNTSRWACQSVFYEDESSLIVVGGYSSQSRKYLNSVEMLSFSSLFPLSSLSLSLTSRVPL